MKPRSASVVAVLLLAAGAVLLAGAPADAQRPAGAPRPAGVKLVPGELWRQTMSMEMQGMSMPGQTSEMCVPKGKEDEAATQSMDPGSCRMYDTVRSGNRFTAKFECTGKEAMKGSMEHVTVDANTTRGSMRVTRDGETMTMRYESTRLGKACQAEDWSGYKPPAAAPVAAGPDACTMIGEEVAKGKNPLRQYVMSYTRPGAMCASPAQLKPFCAAVQTPEGFADLRDSEASIQRMGAQAAVDLGLPLADSMKACGLGSGPDAVEKLRVRMVAVAKDRGSWDFLVAEAGDAEWEYLRETAKAQCTGRAFSAARQVRYGELCAKYGRMLVQGDRGAAKAIARANLGGSGEDAGSGDAPADGAQAPTEPQSPTKDLLKKGRGVLRGILGGG